GEVSRPVAPLTLPDADTQPSDALASEAARLFVTRAITARPTFQLDEASAQVVADICVRLDGIPLAIELAAARVKVLTLAQISHRLDDRFRLLTGGEADEPRHQT